MSGRSPPCSKEFEVKPEVRAEAAIAAVSKNCPLKNYPPLLVEGNSFREQGRCSGS